MIDKDRTCSPERVAVVRWVAGLGAVTAAALAARDGTTVAAARAQLGTLEKAGWLVRERPLTGQPALYAATRAGLRLSGLRGLDPCHVSAAGAQHLIECARVAAALERCYPDHHVLGERELRRDERERGVSLASASLGEGPRGELLLHRPDLVLLRAVPVLWNSDRPESGHDLMKEMPIAVEVELTIKAPRRLVEICRAWARCRTIAGVLYLAPPTVQRALVRAIERSAAHERIVVVGLDALR